ncbi:MAG: hypothetical protein L0Z55_09995 [Planctomycetes bacterium]|nr:hypothetical protein [Planctomycetota bacterium]
MAKSRRPVGKKGGAGSKPRLTAAADAPLASAALARAGGYEILCSECYSEFAFRGGAAEGQITCPDCLHVGSIADPESMSKILVAKRREKSALLLSLVPALLFLITAFAWIATVTYSAQAPSQGANYTFSGLAAVFFFAMLAFGIKYESHRCDVYF